MSESPASRRVHDTAELLENIIFELEDMPAILAASTVSSAVHELIHKEPRSKIRHKSFLHSTVSDAEIWEVNMTEGEIKRVQADYEIPIDTKEERFLRRPVILNSHFFRPLENMNLDLPIRLNRFKRTHRSFMHRPKEMSLQVYLMSLVHDMRDSPHLTCWNVQVTYSSITKATLKGLEDSPTPYPAVVVGGPSLSNPAGITLGQVLGGIEEMDDKGHRFAGMWTDGNVIVTKEEFDRVCKHATVFKEGSISPPKVYKFFRARKAFLIAEIVGRITSFLPMREAVRGQRICKAARKAATAPADQQLQLKSTLFLGPTYDLKAPSDVWIVDPASCTITVTQEGNNTMREQLRESQFENYLHDANKPTPTSLLEPRELNTALFVRQHDLFGTHPLCEIAGFRGTALKFRVKNTYDNLISENWQNGYRGLRARMPITDPPVSTVFVDWWQYGRTTVRASALRPRTANPSGPRSHLPLKLTKIEKEDYVAFEDLIEDFESTVMLGKGELSVSHTVIYVPGVVCPTKEERRKVEDGEMAGQDTD